MQNINLVTTGNIIYHFSPNCKTFFPINEKSNLSIGLKLDNTNPLIQTILFQKSSLEAVVQANTLFSASPSPATASGRQAAGWYDYLIKSPGKVNRPKILHTSLPMKFLMHKSRIISRVWT